MLFPSQNYTEYLSSCFQGNTIQIQSIYHPWKWAPMFFNTLVKFHISNHIIPSSCPQGYSHTHMEQPENEGGRSKVSNRPSAWLANKSRGVWATIWHFTRTICQCSHTYNAATPTIADECSHTYNAATPTIADECSHTYNAATPTMQPHLQ